MDENQKQEKPFDTVAIVLLLLVAGISDIADLFTDLIAPVPVIGQVVYFFNSFLISPLTWAIIQGWFIMKVGLSGRSGIIAGVSNLLGGLGNIANIPGSETVTTIIAIFAANAEQKIAEVAGAAGLGAELAAAKMASGGGALAASGEGVAGGEKALGGTAAQLGRGGTGAETGAMASVGGGGAAGEKSFANSERNAMAGERTDATNERDAAEQKSLVSPEALGEELPYPENLMREDFQTPAPPAPGDVELDGNNVNLQQAA